MNEWMNEQMNEWTNETKQTETRKVANSNSILEIPTLKKLYFTLLYFYFYNSSPLLFLWSLLFEPIKPSLRAINFDTTLLPIADISIAETADSIAFV